MNHKEVVRQISELQDEDFSLLQRALSEPLCEVAGSQSPVPPRLHIGLGAEDLEEGSVAEQLEAVLEKLRLDNSVGVCCSADSGAVSDLDIVDSCTTGLAEGGGGRSESVVLLDACDDEESGSCSGVVPRETGETTGPCGVEVEISSGQGVTETLVETAEVSEKASTDSRARASSRKITQVDSVELHHESGSREPRHTITKSEPLHRNTKPGDAQVSRNTVRTAVKTGEAIQSRMSQPKPKVSTSVIQHHAPCGGSDGDRRAKVYSKPLPATAEPQSEREDGCPSTEGGGPFITHWRKGRWKRGEGGRERNSRKPHNQPHVQQRKEPDSTQGNTRRPRYSTKRDTRNSTLENYPTSSSSGSHAGKPLTTHRDTPSTAQKNTDTPVALTKTSTTTTTVQSITAPETSRGKLSYARVAGCVRTSKPSSNGTSEKPGREGRVSDIAGTVSQCGPAVAASFNYNEVVQFLWSGKCSTNTTSRSSYQQTACMRACNCTALITVCI